MKHHLLLPLAVGLALTTAGCITTQEAMEPAPASQADVQYLREELRRLSARQDATDGEVGRIASEMRSSRAGQPDAASATQVQSMQAQVDDLQRQIRALDAARGQDKKQIYDDISQKVTGLLKTTTPAATRTSAQTGYEHVVQSGESLSAIAAAYKAKVPAIVKANNLKSADQIFVGQKLFIPD